ncbi:Uncharacterized protein OBRU01_16397 [Operophtera brumata]|uniref:Intraflagellar transport protein 122 homolog n=1 Tax=Operophtera brumata TaxID=104452 RepID=A0A0L7L2M3_OPEBR|nr:Uncharacterized protein OBRU01_16397 [Operophtera brumata]
MVYDPRDGALVQLLQAHKGAVHAVAYCGDGKKFASGSADKNVIIWSYKMEGAVQKYKLSGRITCCAWSSNGQHLAIGLASGVVSIRDKSGEEVQVVMREAAVWAVTFSKSTLLVTDWNENLSFYNVQGQPTLKERKIVGGAGGWSAFTAEGVPVAHTDQDWVWCVAPSPSLTTLVQLPERVVVYEQGDAEGMLYRVKEKLPQRSECSLLSWTVPAPIRYVKVTTLYFEETPASVRCLDVSASRASLAVVDEASVCRIYNLPTGNLLHTEENVSSVSWNSWCDELLSMSGGGLLSIKAGNFPPATQPLSGSVVGFQTVNVPLSHAVHQYIQQKLFSEAYAVACLGVTALDWERLGFAALEELSLEVAKKAFQRSENIVFLTLIDHLQERLEAGEKREVILGEMLAYRGRYNDAARSFRSAGRDERALNMFVDLRMFNKAQVDRAGTQARQGVERVAALRRRGVSVTYHMAGETATAMRVFSILVGNAYERLARVYHAYDAVHRCVHEPFSLVQPDALLNAARYVLALVDEDPPPGISMLYPSQTHHHHHQPKEAKALAACNLAKQMLDKILGLQIPQKFYESVELLVIKTRGSDGGDSGPRDEDVAQLCWRCRRHAPPLTSAVCSHCGHTFVHSLATHVCRYAMAETKDEDESDDSLANDSTTSAPGSPSNGHHSWR